MRVNPESAVRHDARAINIRTYQCPPTWEERLEPAAPLLCFLLAIVAVQAIVVLVEFLLRWLVP